MSKDETKSLSKEEAQNKVQECFDLFSRQYKYTIDQLYKSFYYMIAKLEEQKEYCDKEKEQDTIRIYDSLIIELKTQLDIIINGEHAEHFKNEINVEYFKSGKWAKAGFYGGLF